MEFYSAKQKEDIRRNNSKEQMMSNKSMGYVRLSSNRIIGVGILFGGFLVYFITNHNIWILILSFFLAILFTIVTTWMHSKYKKEIEEIFKETK